MDIMPLRISSMDLYYGNRNGTPALPLGVLNRDALEQIRVHYVPGFLDEAVTKRPKKICFKEDLSAPTSKQSRYSSAPNGAIEINEFTFFDILKLTGISSASRCARTLWNSTRFNCRVAITECPSGDALPFMHFGGLLVGRFRFARQDFSGVSLEMIAAATP